MLAVPVVVAWVISGKTASALAAQAVGWGGDVRLGRRLMLLMWGIRW